MPNWADDEGRFYWGDQEIPHPPVRYVSRCKCCCCNHQRELRRLKREIARALKAVEILDTQLLDLERNNP